MDIDSSVRQYYEAQELNRARLDTMLALAGTSSSGIHFSGRDDRREKRNARITMVLATCLAASLLVALTLFIVLQSNASMNLNERAAHEIAMNHLKDLEAEYTSDDLETISGQMAKLGFTLRQPGQVDLAGLTLIGARYCSIQGEIAALLKYRNRDGESVTLYQTRASPRLKNLAFDDTLPDDTRIKIWREGNQVYGLAE